MQLFGFDTERQFDYENGFYLTSHVTRLGKLLAHYELYKMITGLSGHVVECGVFKGTSLIRFATFREVLESPFSRKVIGFDAFGAFPSQEDELDSMFVKRFEAAAGHGIEVEELNRVLAHKGIRNVELVKGDILRTVPEYVRDHQELKIALLHIDTDVYRPAVAILQHLFDRVVRGGLVVFDDYGEVAGETRAVDEFFAGRSTRLQKLPISHIPAYVVKE